MGHLQEVVDMPHPVDLADVDEAAELLCGVREERGRIGSVGNQVTPGGRGTVVADEFQNLRSGIFQGRRPYKGSLAGFALPEGEEPTGGTGFFGQGNLFGIAQRNRFAEEGEKENDQVFTGQQSEDVGEDDLSRKFLKLQEDHSNQGEQTGEDPAQVVAVDQLGGGVAGSPLIFSEEEGDHDVKSIEA